MKKYKKTIQFSIYILIVLPLVLIFSCGYGYVGELPKLGKYSNISATDQIKDSEPIIPLAPKTVPANYSGVIVNNGKYSQYLKDLDALIPVLESMKQSINDKDTNIQMFCAKVSTINLYVNNLKDKYNGKTERHYESFKQLLVLNKNLNETADYWYNISKYNGLIRGSLKDRQTDEKVMTQKLKVSLRALDITLEILKENNID